MTAQTGCCKAMRILGFSVGSVWPDCGHDSLKGSGGRGEEGSEGSDIEWIDQVTRQNERPRQDRRDLA